MIAVYLALSYLIGAIPFGVIVARMQGIDIMSVGSKNIGATNVMRVLGKKWGIFVLLLDVAKGCVPALVVWKLTGSQEMSILSGLVAVLGHCVSPFLRFRGGKGIATGLGAMLGSMPPV